MSGWPAENRERRDTPTSMRRDLALLDAVRTAPGTVEQDAG